MTVVGNPDVPSQVVDKRGHRHRLGRCLGRGGQGAVYQVEGGRLAVKLLFDRSPARRELLSGQLARVRRFELKDVPIVRPMEMLRPPYLGYVMQRLTGMDPIQTLARPPRNGQPRLAWYHETGGLRRRLRLLARCGEALAQVHGCGLVFADPSPTNFFVSAAVEDTQARLIDADNLHYESSPGSSVYTPTYGAPELELRLSGTNTLTDAHAFAVVAFQTLSLVHPLFGDVVMRGDPELEAQALQGKLPWIEKTDDTRNRSSDGVPRDLILSPHLSRLSQRAFGEGLRNRLKRPGVAEWVERLDAAADFSIPCEKCSGTFYANRTKCPWCDSPRRDFVLVRVKRWEPDGGKILDLPGGLPLLALTQAEPLVLTKRVTAATGRSQSGGPTAELRMERTISGQYSVLTKELGEARQWITRRDGSPRTGALPVLEGLFESQRDPWLVHFGHPEKPHRVATFELVPGERS